MTADAPDARTLADLAARTRSDVEALREGLANLSAELERAPFFIRSFVEKELSTATELTLPEWAVVLGDLSGRLSVLRDMAGGAEAGAGIAGTDAVRAQELPDLVESIEALRGFLRKVPGKLNIVPPLLLGSRDRAEFIANVEEQVTHLEAVATALPRLAREAAHLRLG